jgi:hypothetical protein
MPKVAIDHKNTIIYKIEHIEKDDLVYVGHTTNWDRRKYQHKQRCNNKNDTKHNLKLYTMMRDNGGWDMFRMIEVEKYPCSDKREADKRETEIMKELKAELNSVFSYVSEEEKKEKHKIYKKEYYGLNKNILVKKQNEYNKTRIEFIKTYKKEYHEINKDKDNKHKKEWYEKNKERIKAEHKVRYKNNKQEILEKQKNIQ